MTHSTDDLQARIDYLYDRVRISDTVNRFFLALDEKAWDALPPLLGESFFLTANPAGPMVRVSITEFIDALIARNGGFEGTTHLNPDHVIDITDRTAHVKAHMYCPHWVDDSAEGLYLAYGRYDIDLVRRGDGWVLTDVIIHIDGARGDSAAIYAAAARRQSAKGAPSGE